METKIQVTGEITAKFYDQKTITKVQRWINYYILKLRKLHPRFMRWYQLGNLLSTDVHKNVICNAGFNAICRRLANDTTYTGIINKMLLGTGTTTAAAADTQLATEAYRNATASGTASANIAYLTAYFTEAECSGTYKEFGNVIDGTGSANTGQLFSHLAGLTWVKTSVVVLVVDCKYTFASV